MNKQELIEEISEKADMTKKNAELVLNAVMDTIEEALVLGDKVQLIGFGTFEVRQRAAREGRNPRNPEEVIKVEACKAPVFKAGKTLRDIVNK